MIWIGPRIGLYLWLTLEGGPWLDHMVYNENNVFNDIADKDLNDDQQQSRQNSLEVMMLQMMTNYTCGPT